MYRKQNACSLAVLALLLSSCGGGDGGGTAPAASAAPAVLVVNSVATPSPAPTPTPTPTPSPAPTASLGSSATGQSVVKPVDPNRLVLADKVFYSSGSYSAYASPWCTMITSRLAIGTDMIDTIDLLPSSFPNDVRIVSKVPLADPNSYGCGVYGYNFVAFGNYDGGSPKIPVAPRKVSAIRSLQVAFDVSRTGSGEYNILNEFYLTSTAGDNAAKLVEIGYFLHPSATAVKFARTGAVIGDYADPSGTRWRVSRVDKFIMLLPSDGNDVLSGTLDVADLLTFLTKNGAVTGDAWFNGMANGVEPVRGESQVTINRWQVTVN